MQRGFRMEEDSLRKDREEEKRQIPKTIEEEMEEAEDQDKE